VMVAVVLPTHFGASDRNAVSGSEFYFQYCFTTLQPLPFQSIFSCLQNAFQVVRVQLDVAV
jgi:hypothetical protein